MKPQKIETKESLKEKTIEVGECWEWQGYKANGTPSVFHKGKMTSVRRLFTELMNKPLKDGYYVPKCKNKDCVKPDHIVFNDRSTHMKKSAANTAGNIARRIKIQRSKRATVGKLTQEIAEEIRLSEGPARIMAEKYNVDKSVICRIRAGKAWVNLSNPFSGLF